MSSCGGRSRPGWKQVQVGGVSKRGAWLLMAVSVSGCPFLGCPHNNSPAVFEVYILGPPIVRNSLVAGQRLGILCTAIPQLVPR